MHVFTQIARRRKAHQEKNPDAKIISLGIGDTTEPLPQFIADAMAKAAAGLATREGYSGCVYLWHLYCEQHVLGRRSEGGGGGG